MCTREGCTVTNTIAATGAALGHDYTSETATAPYLKNKATCIADAVYFHKCSRCESRGATTWTKEGSALGHAWGEYQLDGDQTCTYDGHKTAECTREGCSEENKIVATGAALGHLFIEYLSHGDVTTEADGHKTAECDRGCGATHTVIDEGSRIRYLCSIGIHNFSEEIESEDTKKSAATCTEKAKYYKSCSACGALSTSDVFEVGEPLGHSFTDYASNGDATCFADGTKSAKCDNGCRETNTVADEGSKLDHTFGLLSEEANSDGLYEKECIHHCGNTIYTIKDALGEGKHIDLIKNSSDQYEMSEDDLVLNDNGSFSSPVNFNVRGSVAYSRLANKDTMTIILPYDVPASDVNGQAYGLESFDGQTLKYKKVNDGLKANVPYLIYKNRGGETNVPLVADQNEATVHATATIDTVRVNEGKTIEFGAFTQTVFLSGDNSNEFDFYGYKNGKFIKAKKDITVSPFRVAVRLTKPSMANRNMSLRSYSINPNELGVVFDDDVTGVDIYDSNIISEGKVNVYDVLGRAIRLNVDAENCLDGLKDGVYVVNGNKVIIKTDK